MTAKQTVTDPVCGMKIAPEAAAATREREGTTHHFCSTDCARRFDADADAYIAAYRAGEVVWPTAEGEDDRGHRA